MSNNNSRALMALFLAIFIDSIGVSLFVPLATPLFIDAQGILPPDASPFFRNLMYGFSIGIFSIMGFIGAPLLGNWSDHVGRKKTILACLAASFVGYVLCALGVVWHSLAFIFIGRSIDGFTGGSMAVAQAAIADITPPEQRATKLGYILLAASLGFIMGPLAAGILSNPQWSSYFDLTTPLLLAAFLSAFNFVLLHFSFKETFIPQEHTESKISVLRWAFSDPAIRQLSWIFLCLQIAWATYFEFINLFLDKTYHFSNQTLGIFLSTIGFCYVFVFCYWLKKLTLKYSLNTLTLTALVSMTLSILLTTTIRLPWVPWIAVFPAAMSLAIGFSVLVTLFSNAVDANHQGRIMGVTASISALSFGSTALISGFMASLTVAMPLFFATACAFIGMLFARQPAYEKS
jgi:DHA1 family tetracycline resistance protein-like MFS transporter